MALLTASLIVVSSLVLADPPAQGGPASKQAAGAQTQVNGVPPIPATPGAVLELIEARPFVLSTPYAHAWRKERPQVDAGWIIVVRVGSDYVRPRQVAQPVLMVGEQVAEPMNVGYASGMLVAIVPAPRGPQGGPALDLAAQPIWFAQPILAETIDAATAAEQKALAERSGIAPFAAEAVAAAKTKGGAMVTLADREALDKAIGALVRAYAADESEQADALEGIAALPAPAK